MSSKLKSDWSGKRYRLHGLTLISDAPLDDLVPLATAETGTGPAVRVYFSSFRNKLRYPRRWFVSWTLPTGKLWLSCAKNTEGYFLRFHDLADFFVDAEGRDIVCVDGSETPLDTLRHLLLDQVLPLVLNLKGREALHAAAVRTPLGVCAFAGPTGTGKSTLAANFLCAGFPVFSDDCLVLIEDSGQILATPGYPGLRLWEDTCEELVENYNISLPVAHYTSKKRLVPREHLGNFPVAPHPVTRIYSLVRPDEVEGKSGLADPMIECLSSRDGFMELVRSAFRLDITDRAMLLRQFHFLERIASHVPVRRLHVPNNFSSLHATRELIVADLEDN